MKYTRLFSNPLLISLAGSLLFFLATLALFRPGYAAPLNDDPKMVWILAGYPGGKPFPFLVYSNVLLGLVLTPLYALHTNLNWEIILFVVLNFLSVWALLYVFLSQPVSLAHKLLAAAGILAPDIYFLLNITYSTIAGIACIAGAVLVLETGRRPGRFDLKLFLWGLALLVIGSLIRLRILILVLSVPLLGLLFFYRSFVLRRLAPALLIVAAMVGAGYLFDRLYTRADPAWNIYMRYNQTRTRLHDTHLLQNLHTEIRRIGWSKNDQELFARWFFADPQVFSLDRLQYLASHVPGQSLDMAVTGTEWAAQVFSLPGLAYILIVFAACLSALASGVLRRAALPLLALFVVFLADNLYLMWAWKVAGHIVLATLASQAIFAILIVEWAAVPGPDATAISLSPGRLPRLAWYASVVAMAAAVALAIVQSALATDLHEKEQAGYARILSDLRALQSNGTLPPGALVVAVTHGIPLEWSNPFVMDFPSVSYLDMGWFTFSPAYEQVLQNYAITSLPDGLYEKDNVYFLSRPGFNIFLAQYYQEHEHIHVAFQPLYDMPNQYNLGGYIDIHLYKVRRAP